MRIGLFCKSCKEDLPWLAQAIKSFQSNWLHPWDRTQWVLAMDAAAYESLIQHGIDLAHVDVRYVEPWPDRYAHAMAMKACADIFCDEANLILIFDSDMILSKPTGLADLMVAGKPPLCFEHWSCERDADIRRVAKSVWGGASIRSTGCELDRDWMVSPAWIFWPSTLKGARRLVELHRKLPFLQAVYSRAIYDWRNFTLHPMTFCDIENLGLYASRFESDKYSIMELKDYRSPVTQFWSHGSIEAARHRTPLSS